MKMRVVKGFRAAPEGTFVKTYNEGEVIEAGEYLIKVAPEGALVPEDCQADGGCIKPDLCQTEDDGCVKPKPTKRTRKPKAQ